MASSLTTVQSQTSVFPTAITTTLGGIQTGNERCSEKKKITFYEIRIKGSGTNGTKNVKDEALPDGLNTLVNQLKDYFKKQKSIKDEIERHSIKSFKKVSDETSKLRKDVSLVSSGIQKDATAVENLKVELSQELINAEIAQQTSNTPLAFQHENTAPQDYFQKLVESFEERMHLYKRQVEEVESHLASLQQPQNVSPQEISDVMKKLHETFITLAARMHEMHEAVKREKERYLDYREKVFGDRINVFERKSVPEQRTYTVLQTPSTTIGPSPFATHKTASSYASLSTATQGFGGIKPPTGFNTNFSSFGTSKPGILIGNSGLAQTNGTTLFGSPALVSTGFGTSNPLSLSNSALGKSIGSSGLGGLGSSTVNGVSTSLQLQKPPAGNKRGKK